MMEAEIEVLQPTNIWSRKATDCWQTSRSEEGVSFLGFRGDTTLPILGFWTSSLQKYKAVNSCSSKLPNTFLRQSQENNIFREKK